MIDRKTGERVAMLFCFRGRSPHTGYFNETLIPILCRKASLPLERQSDIRYTIEWTTLGEYLDFLVERGVVCNVASFVGATSVRVHEVGYADRPPTSHELERMCGRVRQAMEEGALGVGSSLIYAQRSTPVRTS